MSARWVLMLSALLVASAVNAQERTECDEKNWWGGWRGGPNAHVCEVRELTVPAPVARCPSMPARTAASASRARIAATCRYAPTVHAWGNDDAEAERIASGVNIRSDGVLRAEGPEQRGRSGWSVSFEVLAPLEIDLSLEAHNGGIRVADVRGDLDLETRNGGINLDGVAGNVRGRTTNGGIEADAGRRHVGGRRPRPRDHERRRAAANSRGLLGAPRDGHRQRRHRHRLSRDGAGPHRPRVLDDARRRRAARPGRDHERPGAHHSRQGRSHAPAVSLPVRLGRRVPYPLRGLARRPSFTERSRRQSAAGRCR